MCAVDQLRCRLVVSSSAQKRVSSLSLRRFYEEKSAKSSKGDNTQCLVNSAIPVSEVFVVEASKNSAAAIVKRTHKSGKKKEKEIRSSPHRERACGCQCVCGCVSVSVRVIASVCVRVHSL